MWNCWTEDVHYQVFAYYHEKISGIRTGFDHGNSKRAAPHRRLPLRKLSASRIWYSKITSAFWRCYSECFFDSCSFKNLASFFTNISFATTVVHRLVCFPPAKPGSKSLLFVATLDFAHLASNIELVRRYCFIDAVTRRRQPPITLLWLFSKHHTQPNNARPSISSNNHKPTFEA